MASELGAYYITIMPSLAGAKKQIESQLSGVDTGVGSKLGKQISSDVTKGLSFEAVGAKFKDLGGQLEATGSKLTGAITKPFMIGAGIAGGFAALIGKSALGAYAEWEQLVGGVDTLFKGASGTVQKYAADAYKTAGLSANAYMSQVTSFSASLLQSLGGDTAAAADAANQAVIDMADNANKMGTAIGSIQDAYQGFAKQNYTMLDNLKLGYGGTKTEMERLLADATKFSGIEYNIDNLSDVYEAIHVIQTEMGITGTTAEEAASTIEGSTAAMKASWSNWLAEIGKTDGDVAGATKKLTDSVVVAFRNVVPRVGEIMRGLAASIPALWEGLKAELPAVFDPLVAKIEAVVGWFNDLSDGAKKTMGAFAAAAVAAGPFLTILGKMSSGVGGLIQWVGRLSPGLAGASGGVSGFIGNIAKFAGPVGIAIAAIAALWTQSEAFRTGITAVGKAIWDLVQQVMTAVQPVIEMVMSSLMPIVGQVGDLIGEMLAFVAPLIADVATMIAGVVTAAMPLVEWILSVLVPIFQTILDTVQNVFTQIQPIVEAAMVFVQAIISTVMAVLSGDWSGAWEGIKEALSAAWELIKTAVSTAIEAVKSTIERVLGSIKENWDSAWESVKTKVGDIWEGIKTAVGDAIENVMDKVRGFKDKVTDFFSGAGDWLYDSGKAIIQGLADGIGAMVSTVTDAVGGVLEAARNLLPFSPAKEGPFSGRGWTLYSGRSIIQAFAEGMISQTGLLESAASSVMARGQVALDNASSFRARLGFPSMSLAAPSGAGFPSELVVVDADGQLIGRMQVEARGEVLAAESRSPLSSGALLSQAGSHLFV